jgi:hypothetical protein
VYSAEKPRRDARGRALERIPSPAPLWQKGQSGNPGGKSGFYHEATRLARELTPAAVRRLGELAGLYPDPVSGEWIPLDRLGVDPRVISVACLGLVERTLGKPKDYDPAQDPDGKPRLAEIVDRWTPEQRALARQLFAVDGKAVTEVNAEPVPESDSSAAAGE